MKKSDASLIDCILFDMDGTLVDVSRSQTESIRRTASYFLKREVTREEVASIKMQANMNNDWIACYALINDPQVAFEDMQSYYQHLYLGTDTSTGLIDTETLLIDVPLLERLNAAYPVMGIVTGRPRAEALYIWKKYALDIFFSCLISLEDATNPKPHPAPLWNAKAQLQVANPLYVGDSVDDMTAARAAGMSSIFVGTHDSFPTSIPSINSIDTLLL